MSEPQLAPIWRMRATPSTYAPLSGDLTVDVVVIGAGITGLTLAHRLKQAGTRVAVVEMRSIGMGATGHTSAHLTAALDVEYGTLIRRFGQKGAEEAASKSMAAIAHIERTATEFGIDCDFRRVDGWRYTEDPKSMRRLRAELQAALNVGLEVELVESGPLPFMQGALRFRNQALFHPVAYISALARLVHGDGCHVFEDTRVDRIVEGTPCRVEVGDRVITAEKVVHATHIPVGLVMPLQARIAPYMTYVMAVEVEGGAPPDLYWDIADPYHYTRPVTLPDGASGLIIGGEDHKSGQEPDTTSRFEALEAYARSHFRVARVVTRWTWEVFEPADGLPYIGGLGGHKHVFGATGFSGTGLTFGTAAAHDIADILLGVDTTNSSVFRPQRYKPIASAGAFLKENANVAWRMVRDRLQGPADATVSDVQPGEGRLVDVDGQKLAVYRSPSGHLHVLSPVCPHAGGIVQWNSAACTWDCPLHGSRFLPNGTLLATPASHGLVPRPDPVIGGEERSVSDLIEGLREQGYTCDFQPGVDGRVRCPACEVDVAAEEGSVDGVHRFEGMSDPDDMCVIVAMRLPRPAGGECRGVLVLSFGPMASLEDKVTFAALKPAGPPLTG
jgi:glycine/D-amino acid oxidase-like deaminating enzyme/nitrite reductase/ring-hydroxylating ferredoxin subunit